MDALEQLLATKEIETLITRCCQLCDDEDWAAFATLWTDDAEFGVEDGPTYSGKETMLGFVTTCLTPGYVGKHICSGTVVDFDPDGETARAKTDVLWIAANFENTILSRYNDTFVKQDGRWLFRRRYETPTTFVPGPPQMSAELAEGFESTTRPA